MTKSVNIVRGGLFIFSQELLRNNKAEEIVQLKEKESTENLERDESPVKSKFKLF